MAKNVIYVGPAGGSESKPLTIEGFSVSAAVVPGTVLENVAAGLQINQSAATVFGQELIVADKDQLRHKSVTDVWTQNENIVAIKARSGEFLNVRVANGVALTARGIPLSLSSNTDGTLGIATVPATVGATSEQVLAYSDEIITTTAITLVRVRVA